MYVLLLI